MRHTIVIGGGIFGVTAALELQARGDRVTLVEPGPLPAPLAESTDISKVIRADYGADTLYTGLMERALGRWGDWNTSIAKGLYHACGVMFVTRTPMRAGAFEGDSYDLLRSRGFSLERIGGRELTRRFPAWNGDAYVDGYFNPIGGYAESGAVVAALARVFRDRGGALRDAARVSSERRRGGKITSVITDQGESLAGDLFVFTVGAWTGGLLSDIAAAFRATGQPVLHFAPQRLADYDEARFPVFGADISRTGTYGFPAIGGVVKVASHGPGRVVDPSSEEARVVGPEDERAIRGHLRDAIPSLHDAPIAKTRLCVYGDTRDGDFWIAPDPEVENRVVAAGGSGHGFKFAPVLGELIADACEGIVEPRFRWRPDLTRATPTDAARQK